MASDLVKEACKAYGIEEKYVLASKEEKGVATVVTHGGTKVRFKAGDQVKRLTPAQIGAGVPKTAEKK